MEQGDERRRAEGHPLRPEELAGGALLRQASDAVHAQLSFVQLLGEQSGSAEENAQDGAFS